ncbi:beta-ketoacyl synthase chain length factor [Modicisalibacter coralii]|uniref:beta-ketoacyl synthase chain length factor n=1 Tax=Modicisalibacter coralii TaxID=2304602 RepID=UPI00100B3B64|nr:beta-ketoacyl synthase chain length factor [Halomonas coralii]
MTPASLFVQDWRAWLPDGDAAGDTHISTEARPAGRSVPAMLRRRLSNPGRAVCDMLADLDPEGTTILLHASRHGDGERTLEMLYSLAENAPLSPARFGLSVHNAVLGVHSIASGNRRSLQAISASGDEWAALLDEACGYLAEGAPRVIAVFSDAPVPARFAAHAPPDRGSAAVAAVLSPAEGREIVPAPASGEALSALDALQPVDIIDWLRHGGSLTSPLRGRTWRLDA